MGCDIALAKEISKALIFQSTQPEWAATGVCSRDRIVKQISIHAARVGCDIRQNIILKTAIIFQSTQPEWAATGQTV